MNIDNNEMGMSAFSQVVYNPLGFNEIDETPDPLLEELEDLENNDNNNQENHESEDDPNASQEENSESGSSSEDDQNEGSDDKSDEDDAPLPNLFSSVATVLSDQGVLPSLDIESSKIETVEDLANAVKSEVQALYKEKLVNKFGEDGFDYIEKGITPEEVVNYQENLNLLNQITDERLSEDVNLAANVIYENYIAKGISDEEARSLVSIFEKAEGDVLIENAKKSLISLKSFQKAKLDQKAATLANEEQARIDKQAKEKESIKNAIYAVKALENGPDISKPIQDKVYKVMHEVVGKDEYGNPENAFMKQRRENKIKFDTNMYYAYVLTDGFKNFEKFGSKSKSNAIKELERALQTTKTNYNGTPNFVEPVDSYDKNPFLGHELNY